MLDEPAGLGPRLREDCSVLAGGSHCPGCSAVASFGRHWVLDSDRGLRKSRKPAVAQRASIMSGRRVAEYPSWRTPPAGYQSCAPAVNRGIARSPRGLLLQHVEARPCLRVRERHPVAEGEEPDALGHARVKARSGLRYPRSEEPAIEPAIDRERHPGDVAGRVARQEHDRAGELLRCPVPAQRHGQRHPPEGVVH